MTGDETRPGVSAPAGEGASSLPLASFWSPCPPVRECLCVCSGGEGCTDHPIGVHMGFKGGF